MTHHVGAVDVLHREVRPDAVRDTAVDQPRNRRVVQAREDPTLSVEAGVNRITMAGTDDFDSDPLLEVRSIAHREVDGAHTP